MPRAKRRVSARKTASASAKLRPAAIDRARDDAMAAIARQRDSGGERALLDNAHRLLTRHWAKADWAARATLIKTADWLIRLAGTGPQKTAAKPRRPAL